LAISIPIRHRADRTDRAAVAAGRPRRRAVVASAAAILVAIAGTATLIRSSLFDARSVVVSGAAHLRRAAVIDAAGIGRGTNVPTLDVSAVEARLLEEPWIASADVSVSWPWTVRIAIRERAPVAVAIDAGRRVLVAEDGTILGSGTMRGVPTIQLPTTAASEGARPSAAGAAAAIGAMDDELRARVSRVVVASDGTLELRLTGGVVVEYGSPTLERRKALALERILGWSATEGERIGRVALAAPDVPAVTFAA